MARDKDRWIISEAVRLNSNEWKAEVGAYWAKYRTLDGKHEVYIDYRRDGQIQNLRLYNAGDERYTFITRNKRQEALYRLQGYVHHSRLFLRINGVSAAEGSIGEGMLRYKRRKAAV